MIKISKTPKGYDIRVVWENKQYPIKPQKDTKNHTVIFVIRTPDKKVNKAFKESFTNPITCLKDLSQRARKNLKNLIIEFVTHKDFPDIYSFYFNEFFLSEDLKTIVR